MDVPGWTFYGLNKGAWEENPAALNASYSNFKCSDARWFGYCDGFCNGLAKTKFNKCGRAHLHIGNCYYTGYTEAKLNGKQIVKVNGFDNKTIEFDFKDGDIFELADISYGIVDLYDFKIISCSSC